MIFCILLNEPKMFHSRLESYHVHNPLESEKSLAALKALRGTHIIGAFKYSM